MAHRIPQAHFIKVPGAGHSVYFEKPDDFNRMLTDFLVEAGVQ
jgi:pimeloyl-ACP methyl ester carboxylesterase